MEVTTEVSANSDEVLILLDGGTVCRVSGRTMVLYPGLVDEIARAVQQWANTQERWNT
jgi:hypothetical protein